MRRFVPRKRLTVLVAVVAVLGISAAAIAFWTGSGTGSGTAAVGSSGAVALTATVSPGIAPGTSEGVSFTAANASGSPITISTVHLNGISVDAGHASCVTGDFSMADVSEKNGGVGHEVPAEATAEPLPNSGTLVYADTGVSQDACKGATLTLTLSTS